ncbi:hypothetical protein [Parasphingopyxis marina]|uniref:Uncharacterized protein n=1 Tax=Parasphingopyxis marina TaxID=2761622 RepID=A0A842I0G1_9SPHN|nr:hypothetical protein [Parasphingopyxis marina]MBC2778129.1 hypothetical protein [Parasphingopyxis marina]
MKPRRIAALALPLLLPLAPAHAQSAEDVGRSARDVALTPLSDLNLRGESVPEILAQISSPYQPIEDGSCDGLTREIAGLDEALGPDIDIAQETDPDTLERVERGASSIVGGLVLPFRGIVREISGARDRERRLLEFHSRGVARRAYLKGIGSARGCPPPAAPLPYGDEEG